ncbi:MAG: DUF1631 family protein [Halioglobus sp.]
MALNQTQALPLAATVELADDRQFSGTASLAAGERIALAISESDRAEQQLTRGSRALLKYESPAGIREAVPVRIDRISSTTLHLEFVDPYSPQTRACLEAVQNRWPAVVDTVDASETTSGTQWTPQLRALQEHSATLLEERLQLFANQLTDHLFDLSMTSGHSESGHNIHYEALNALKKEGRKIVSAFLAEINTLYDDLTPEAHERQRGREQAKEQSLGLVDIEEFEGYLALDRMITRGEELHQVALEALVIRVGTLLEADPLSVRLPVHIEPLCNAFQTVLRNSGLPADVIPQVLSFFVDQFIEQLDGFYSPLNAELAERGIRPNIEEEIINKGSLLKAARREREAAAAHSTTPSSASTAPTEPETQQDNLDPATTAVDSKNETVESADSLPDLGAPQPAATEESPAPTSAKTEDLVDQVVDGVFEKISERFSPESLYRSVIDALNFKREAQGLTGVANSPTGNTNSEEVTGLGSMADTRTVADALGALQTDADSRAAVQSASSLREYLAANAGNISGLAGTDGLNNESLNQIDLVDNLFGTINSQLDVSADLRPALGNLQIPMAKLALMEPQFFVDRGHAARGVIDKLSQLASSSNFPNRSLETRVGEIVDQIVTDYDTDSAVFENALAKINKLVQQQERAHTKNVDRVVRTQQGQEKLAQAQQAVDQFIAQQLKPPHAPKVLMELVEHGWRDQLILTHVKQGPDSSAWDESIKSFKQVSSWLEQQLQGDIDSDDQLERQMEAEPLIDMIEQQINTALPANVEHVADLNKLRAILAGDAQIVTAEIDANRQKKPSAQEQRARIDRLPRLKRWIQRVEALEKGSWLTYRDKDGQQRRMQLAWISEDKDRYIFVNERGQKNAELSAVQLARQLSRGVQPPAPADKLNVVDKSMYGTLEQVQKTLSFERNHDSLTKLINRETFIDQVQRAMRHSQRKSATHSMLYINIDQFNLVNEVYDKINGDQVLLEFARLLAQLHSKKTSSARLGGDEFGVLLIDRSAEVAVQIAEKIRNDIAASSVEVDGEPVTFTVSIGISEVLPFSKGVDEIIRHARSAMQLAKDQGRNKVVVYQEDQEQLLAQKQEHSETRAELEQALSTDRFVLRAQPIVQTVVGSNKLSDHFELLLGLKNDEGGLDSPEEFITSAERYGFMSLVDRWVINEAFAWVSHLNDAQKVVPNISINLSGTSITDDSFMDFLLEQISEFGVGTSRLCFEITETGTISNLVKAADFVRTLRNIGCKFSIDDFGTGLASHNYLRELPVDYVKIDGTFITDIHNNRNDFAMARSINDLAHFLGQETIAESVENDLIIEQLREIGVDFLQGWGVGMPKLLAEVTEELSTLEK